MMTNKPFFPLTMPKWGMAMTEGTVVAWLKEEGGVVSKGDEVFEVETEKIVNVVEATESGVLLRRLLNRGETVPVGALVGVLGDSDASEQMIEGFVSDFRQSAQRKSPEENAPETGMTTVTINGRILQYFSMGNGDETVVMLHGFGGDLSSWLFNQAPLAKTLTTIALDLPGHGGSSKQLDYGTVAELAESIRAFCEVNDIKRCHLVGHSLGGAIAAQLATQNPSLIGSLTLIASAGPGTQVDVDYVEGFIAAKRRKDIKPLLQQLFADPSLVGRDMVDNILKAKRLDGVGDCLRKIADGAVLAAVTDSPQQFLAKLETPTQILWGTADRIAAMEQMSNLSRSIQQHALDNAGHMPHMEASAQVNRLIRSFVEQNS